MCEARIIRIVVISANDVKAERDAVRHAIDFLNKSTAEDRSLVIKVYLWEADAFPGFHRGGRQAGIDEVLRIEDCHLLVTIFWKRFGTPVRDALSGTEHEFRLALKHWRETGRPQIMAYFNQERANPTTQEELEQWSRVLEFKENFPEEGLWWNYEGASDFEKKFRNHVTQFIRQEFPLPSEPHTNLSTHPPQSASVAPADATRCVELFVEGAVPARLGLRFRRRLRRSLSRLLGVPLSDVEIISAEEVKAAKLTINLPAPVAERLLKTYQTGESELTRLLHVSAVRARQAAARQEEVAKCTQAAAAAASVSDEIADERDADKDSTDPRSPPYHRLTALLPPSFRIPIAVAMLLFVVTGVSFLNINDATRRRQLEDAVAQLNPRAANFTPLPDEHVAAEMQMVYLYPDMTVRGPDSSRFARVAVDTAIVLFLLEVPELDEHRTCDLTLSDSESRILFIMRDLECVGGKQVSIRVPKGAIPRGDYNFSLSRGQDFQTDYRFRVVRND
jgi:hypothetical protein